MSLGTTEPQAPSFACKSSGTLRRYSGVELLQHVASHLIPSGQPGLDSSCPAPEAGADGPWPPAHADLNNKEKQRCVHTCLPPSCIARAPKCNTENKLHMGFLQRTTYSTHPNPERKSQMGNHTKDGNFTVRNLNLPLKPYTYGHVNRPILNEDPPFQCGIRCNVS